MLLPEKKLVKNSNNVLKIPVVKSGFVKLKLADIKSTNFLILC